MDRLAAGLAQPRAGMVALTAVTFFIMAAHWLPLTVPGILLVAVAVLRPGLATRPHLWWGAAAVWLAAGVLVSERMEDHVYLFTAWLVALALALAEPDDEAFVARAAWHARVLVGATFATAVAWKLYFGDYVTGTTLWVFILADARFEPLALGVGLSSPAVEADRAGVRAVLDGSADSWVLEGPTHVVARVMAAALLTLLIEAVIAVAHLAPDTSRLAVLRLPSLVLFAVVTYAVVPVVPFAALLAVLAMAVGRWRQRVLWVFPVLMLVSLTRLAFVA